MTEYRYRELTEDELRRLEPGAEIWVRNLFSQAWTRRQFLRMDVHGRVLAYLLDDPSNASPWLHAAIREPVEQVITMDREWQTRDGRQVTLYCVDAPGSYPVHGRIDGRHTPASWKQSGRYCADGASDADIIPAPDWREQIPWSALADWVQWVARDEDGEWVAHEKTPCQRDGYWYSSSRDQLLVGPWKWQGKAPGDWREAIAQRPDGGVS